MKRRDAIKSLAAACNINTDGVQLQDLPKDGVFAFICPESMGEETFIRFGQEWTDLWKGVPENPKIIILDTTGSIINLKDMI